MRKKNTFKFHLAAKIYLVEKAYYLKQVFSCYFLQFYLPVKIDLGEVVYYLKQVFHLLSD